MLSGRGTLPIDLLKSCANCRVQHLCLPGDMSRSEIEQLEKVVYHPPLLHRGERLFSLGTPLNSIYTVRSGSLKGIGLSKSGKDQVISFSMCGDILGLEAIETGYHRTSSVALETTSVCAVPFDVVNELANRIPALQRQLFRILSHKLETDNLMTLNFSVGSAQQKLMGFLLNLSERHGMCNYSTHEFNLRMTHRDMASYLGLAYETVSRLLAHLQEVGLIKIKSRKLVQILQPRALFSAAG